MTNRKIKTRYAGGGISLAAALGQGIQSGIGQGFDYIENQNTSNVNPLLQGAKGFFTANPLKGELAPVKAIKGFLGANKANKAARESERQAMIQKNYQNALSQFDPYETQESYLPTFAMGGMSGIPNAELEQGEPFRLPNGQIESVSTNAPTHAQGGVDLNLPGGTEILGKGQATDDKQFKDLGRKLHRLQKRHEKILKNRPTRIAKETSERMLDKTQKEFSSLMSQQEFQKSNGKFCRGGKTKYPFGGISPTYNPALNLGIQDTIDNMPKQNAFSGLNNLPIQDIAETAGTYAPIAYNLYKSTQAPQVLDEERFQNPYETNVRRLMGNRRYDVNPELEANRAATQGAYRQLRNLGMSAGRQASNLSAIQIQRQRADASVYARKQNALNQFLSEEAGVLGDLGNTRATRALQIQDINDRNAAAQRAYLPTALTQVQQATQTRQLMRGQKQQDEQRINALNSLLTNYNITPEGLIKYLEGNQ